MGGNNFGNDAMEALRLKLDVAHDKPIQEAS